MRKLPLLISLLASAILTACGGTTGDSPPSPPAATPPPETSPIEITGPLDGSIIYAEVLYLSGEAPNPPQSFRVEAITPDNAVIAQTNVNAETENWAVELVHGYTGDPTEVTIRAVSDDGAVEHDTISVLLSDSSHRPDGTFGSITTPHEGTEVGGDSILVGGRASGLFENDFVLELLDENNNVIDMEIVLVYNPSFIDDVPWEAELAVNDYTGPATIRAYAISPQDGSEILLDSVNVIISTAAG